MYFYVPTPVGSPMAVRSKKVQSECDQTPNLATANKEKIFIISTAKTDEDGYAIRSRVTKADLDRPRL